jgi:hypothetical protein
MTKEIARSAVERKRPFTPHKYQQEAIRLMIKQGAAGLLLDPG